VPRSKPPRLIPFEPERGRGTPPAPLACRVVGGEPSGVDGDALTPEAPVLEPRATTRVRPKRIPTHGAVGAGPLNHAATLQH